MTRSRLPTRRSLARSLPLVFAVACSGGTAGEPPTRSIPTPAPAPVAAPHAAAATPAPPCETPLRVDTRFRPADSRTYPAGPPPERRPDGVPDLDVPTFHGEPLWSPKSTPQGAVVSPAVFPGGLHTVTALPFGACALWPGDVRSIGRIAKPAYDEIGAAGLVRFLIETDTIRTFLHVHAELCLAPLRRQAGRDVIGVTGTHAYCTNECEEDRLAFSVLVDDSGIIYVRSDEPGKPPADLEQLRVEQKCPSG